MLYCLINALAGRDAEIERDPLGKRYEVNKNSIHVRTTNIPLAALQQGIESSLRKWGWVLDKSTSMNSWSLTEGETTAHITISSLGRSGNEYLNLHVMVYRNHKES